MNLRAFVCLFLKIIDVQVHIITLFIDIHLFNTSFTGHKRKYHNASQSCQLYRHENRETLLSKTFSSRTAAGEVMGLSRGSGGMLPPLKKMLKIKYLTVAVMAFPGIFNHDVKYSAYKVIFLC